jgi:hypothetical protein
LKFEIKDSGKKINAISVSVLVRNNARYWHPQCAGLLKNPEIRWQAFQQNEKWLCEHIGFCKSLKQVSGKSVSIATDCAVYWDASTVGQ